MADLYVEEHGSTVLLVPLSPVGRGWIEENVYTEPWQWYGGGIACEPRYADDVVDGARADGMIVTRSLERHAGADPRD